MIGIYKITSKNNPNIFYVGKSNDIERRFKEHIQKTYEQSRIPFDALITNENKNTFDFEVLELCSIDQLSEKEKCWTDKLQATKSGNIFDGGLTDVVGEHNPKSKLTENDVIYIRQAYSEHKKQKEVYEKFKNIISFNHFQNVWQGRVWSHIMPEVFTEENKQYYVYENSRGESSSSSAFTDEEVMTIRTRYINESAKQIYQDYKDRVAFQSFQMILWGRYYDNLPIYKKKEKRWTNN